MSKNDNLIIYFSVCLFVCLFVCFLLSLYFSLSFPITYLTMFHFKRAIISIISCPYFSISILPLITELKKRWDNTVYRTKYMQFINYFIAHITMIWLWLFELYYILYSKAGLIYHSKLWRKVLSPISHLCDFNITNDYCKEGSPSIEMSKNTYEVFKILRHLKALPTNANPLIW